MNCSSCGTAVREDARFCEACGAALGPTPVSGLDVDAVDLAAAPRSPRPFEDAPISAPTRKPASALPDPPTPGRRPCTECGGEVGPDRY
ncbi:MAG: zinc ribbon domain-containing protein, partial [Nocardioidaceae bacterium]|nr:zinc ribbon domain-containing protein [Nocardioidaceae bacterium]